MDAETLEFQQNLARRLIVGFDGLTVDPATDRAWRISPPGGVCLFARNLGNPRQICSLTAQLREILGPEALMMIDQEGGTVARLKEPFTLWPPAAVVGLAGEREPAGPLEEHPAFGMGRAVGEELLWAGINVDLAPVADIDTNPANPVIGNRAWGSTAETVIRAAGAFAAGLAQKGVWPCIKHFPGHGDTLLDSHRELPRLDQSLEELHSRELLPFAALKDSVPLMMTAHLLAPAVDPLPVTLSSAWIGRILRREIGFGGLVITDDLMMGAIARTHEPVEATAVSLLAGADLALLSEPLPDFEQFVLELGRRIGHSDRIRECLVEARNRETEVRKRWPLPAGAGPDDTDEERMTNGWPPHRALAESLRKQAEAKRRDER